jgi:predicted ester cyclase
MHLEIHELIADGDKVVVRFTNSGTNIGAFLNNPPTGRHAEWLSIGIYTLRDGRITEGWFAEDILGILLQLEGSPTPTDRRFEVGPNAPWIPAKGGVAQRE